MDSRFFGYAFVNCASDAEVLQVMSHFEGFVSWAPGPSPVDEEALPCEFKCTSPFQGMREAERCPNLPEYSWRRYLSIRSRSWELLELLQELMTAGFKNGPMKYAFG